MRRAERQHTPPEPEPDGGLDARISAELAALKRAGAAEQGGTQCDAPRNSGWRPGARWARSEAAPPETPSGGRQDTECRGGDDRAEVEQRIARMNVHQRPPMREMGRRSEAADHAFKRLPSDDVGVGATGLGTGWAGPMVPVRFGGEGVRPTSGQRRDVAAAIARGEAAVPDYAPGAHHPSNSERSASTIMLAEGAASARGAPRPALPDTGSTDAATMAGALTPTNGAEARIAGVGGVSARGSGDAAHVGQPRANGGDGRLGTVSRGGSGATAVPLRSAMPAIRYPGEGPHPDKGVGDKRGGERDVGAPGSGERRAGGRVGSNDAGARVRPVEPFFDTGRSTAGTVARACPADAVAVAAALPVAAASHLAVPLVTVQKVGSRVEVAAACPVAHALGITPGMALTQVRAANPGIAVRDADPAGDRAALDRLATMLAQRWSPCVSISDADGLFIDLTGVSHLHGGERRMAARIVRLLHRLGYAARVGVADTPAAAWALARYGDTRAGADVRDAVALLPAGHGLSPFGDHPVAALRLDEAATELMRRLGIDRVSQLAALPRAPLARRFGRAVTTRLDQLTGAVAEPVDPVTPEEPMMVEQRFAEPIMTAEPIAHWMAQLIARLAQVLAERGRGARMVALALTRVDGEVQVVRAGFARATRDPAHVLRLLARRIELIDPGFGIEIMGLHVTRGEPLGPQALAGDLEQQVPDLAALVDAIVNRIGASRLWRARAVESDVPERSVASTAPLDQATGAGATLTHDDVRRLDAREVAHPWHPRWPRPARLLRRPEPIDNVMAELPDSYPRRFSWRGQMHQVVCGDGPERITGEWWRRVAERQAVRDYFQVEDEAGQRFWLFRRGDGQRVETGDMTWYIHGTFA